MVEGSRAFGSYILFHRYTDDAFGHLYRGAEIGGGEIVRTVFLRVFDTPHLATADIVEGFQLARRTADALQAANVPTGVRYVEHRGVPAMVWDWVPAQPLSTVLDRIRSEGFPIAPDNALLVLEKLSLALTAALAVDVDGSSHAHGLLHPALTLLTTDGDALVTGFGIADRLLPALDQPEARQDIYPFMAPEMLDSRLPSKRADVYSLGAVLFSLLTGSRLPAEPAERVGVIDGARLSYDDRPLPTDIKVLLGRAVAHRPEDRYSSAADFKKELDRLLYGGAYSPTTFNLALFMDRLFRSEIDAEERQRADEERFDVGPFLEREVTPTPIESVDVEAPGPPRVRPVYVGVLAAVVVAALGWGIWSKIDRAPGGAPAMPTPTAEQIQAARAEQERHLQQLVQSMVQEKMAEREQQIREELTARQTRIEELQQRLRESEQRARRRELTAQEKRQQQELERQIAAEESATEQRQAELDAERRRVADELATTAAGTPAESFTEPPPGSPSPAQLPSPAASPTSKPRPTATAVTVERNAFYEPSEVDTLPVLLTEEPVKWSRIAQRSRFAGMVIVQVTVNADGRVDDAKVLRCDHTGLDIPEAVLDAVRQYNFKPAIKSGVPVTSHATVVTRYRFPGP